MALKITELKFWRSKIEDRPGGAAAILGPLGQAKVDLEFVLARRTPEEPGKGVIYVASIKGAKAEQAAAAAGLAPSDDVAGVRVEGDNKPGIGASITAAIAGAGVSFRGLCASVLGKKYVCYLALDAGDDARKVSEALKGLGKKGKK